VRRNNTNIREGLEGGGSTPGFGRDSNVRRINTRLREVIPGEEDQRQD
jgi:hypothetical protein